MKIDENSIPPWLLKGRFVRFMAHLQRFFLSIFVLIGLAMLGLVVWCLFFAPAGTIEGIDDDTPFLHKLQPIGFLFAFIAISVFGLIKSFQKPKS